MTSECQHEAWEFSPPQSRRCADCGEWLEDQPLETAMIDEAKALVEREGMQVLLPPAAGVDGDYLMGWIEGQAYLISIYGTDEASDQAFTVAHQVHRMQNLIETQAREIERLRGHWQFLNDLLEKNIVENDQPHRVKLKDGWHDGPVADHHVRTMLAIKKLARAALAGDSHDQ